MENSKHEINLDEFPKNYISTVHYSMWHLRVVIHPNSSDLRHMTTLCKKFLPQQYYQIRYIQLISTLKSCLFSLILLLPSGFQRDGLRLATPCEGRLSGCAGSRKKLENAHLWWVFYMPQASAEGNGSSNHLNKVTAIDLCCWQKWQPIPVSRMLLQT